MFSRGRRVRKVRKVIRVRKVRKVRRISLADLLQHPPTKPQASDAEKSLRGAHGPAHFTRAGTEAPN